MKITTVEMSTDEITRRLAAIRGYPVDQRCMSIRERVKIERLFMRRFRKAARRRRINRRGWA